ncbi:MAG: YybH family protein [Acidimicrobiia bacterium]
MATATTTDEATILELHHGFVEANKTGDTSYLRAHMAPGPEGFRWYNLNKSVYVGMEHIIRLWDFLVALGGQATIPIKEEQVHVSGDVAFVSYIMQFDADFGAMGKVSQSARSTEIWERQNGEWKMIHFHCSEHEPGGWEGGL